jgi:HK97 family phage major capsid protein
MAESNATTFTSEILSEVKNLVSKEVELKQAGKETELKRYQENADKKWLEIESKMSEVSQKAAKAQKDAEDLKELEAKVANLERIGSTGKSAPESKEAAIEQAKELVSAFARTSNKNRTNEYKKFITDNSSASALYTKTLNKTNVKGIDYGSISNLVTESKAAPNVLRSDIGEFGEFLCPIEWSNVLEHQIIETTPIRQYARTMTIGGKTFKQPIRQGVPTALWQGETDTTGISQSNYTNIDMSPYRLSNQTVITWDLIQDSAYNISDELVTDNAIAMAQAEGYAAVKGDGVHQSLGFTVDPNVPKYTNTIASSYTIGSKNYPVAWEDIIGMTGQLKSGYNPIFACNRRTFAYLRTLVDSNNRPIFLAPFGNIESGPMTINGYKIDPGFIDMDDVTVANGNPLVFADFAKFYRIVDRASVILIRDEYTRAAQGEVVYTLEKWTSGMPVIKEAGIIMVRNG